MMIQKILIGTTNKGKQEDYRKILQSIVGNRHAYSLQRIQILFPQDLNITEIPVETGNTFAENSLLKAKFYYEKSGIPTIADDGGLEIPILNNEPGVYSHRWLGYDASDEKLIDYTLERLKQYKTKKERKAYLTVCITYYMVRDRHAYPLQEFGKIAGYISNQINPNYIKGYPFRSLFMVLPIEKYYGELSPEEYVILNHREKALKQLWKRLELVYNK